MGIKKTNPTSAGRRGYAHSDQSDITTSEPLKKLLAPKSSSGGRNHYGRVCTRFRGGGHKRRYRIIDFKRFKIGVPAVVATIEYDPNRTARIALLHYADGEKTYILAPDGLKVGDSVLSSRFADIRPGNNLPLAHIPAGTLVHNIELRTGKGGQLRPRHCERGRLLLDQTAQWGNPPGAPGVPRQHRSGLLRRAPARLSRQGRPRALARSPASQPRRQHEPRRPSHGRW